MYEVGDIVSLPTGELFAFYFEERETLEYTARENIYGVVTNANLSYDLHHVRWAIEGMFNLPQVEWEVLNDQMFFTEELTLIREETTLKFRMISTLRCFFCILQQGGGTTT